MSQVHESAEQFSQQRVLCFCVEPPEMGHVGKKLHLLEFVGMQEGGSRSMRAVKVIECNVRASRTAPRLTDIGSISCRSQRVRRYRLCPKPSTSTLLSWPLALCWARTQIRYHSRSHELAKLERNIGCSRLHSLAVICDFQSVAWEQCGAGSQADKGARERL